MSRHQLKLLSLSLTSAGLIAGLFFARHYIFAETSLAETLKGRILLQAQSHGEAWYISPVNNKRYYLGRPSDAYNLMRTLSLGIRNSDLNKIPVGVMAGGNDADLDGLNNELEVALGTNPQKADSDSDGYNDLVEVNKNYDPLSSNKQNINLAFTKKLSGRILLQTEKQGQAWYLNPVDQKRYFLGRPTDAFDLMRKFGLGISDENLNKITLAFQENINPTTPTTTPITLNDPITGQLLSNIAQAIRSDNASSAVAYFASSTKPLARYTMNFLDSDGRLTLGNIMSGSTLTSSNSTEKIYSNDVYFSLTGEKVKMKFIFKKQPDNSWLLTNL